MLPIEMKIDNPQYPEKIKLFMKKNAPQKLYVYGNLDLLNHYSIGFCGSRKASKKGLDTAQDCAEQASEHNISVISGNALGVDCEAHFHSLKSGGSTILVLPEGINHFKIKKTLQSVWDWDRVLVISQFNPDDIWTVYRAMGRNKLIIALSNIMIVIEASIKGGTMNAGLETLKYSIPLFVAEYENMINVAQGNKLLLEKGALRLTKSKSTNRAKFSKILEKIYLKDNDNIMMKQHTLL